MSKTLIKNYKVVEFEADKGSPVTVEAVPENWITDDQQKCYFPQCARPGTLSKLINNCSPSEKSWPKYNCRVFKGSFSKFNLI
jgi:hypothetical protein